MVNTHYKDNVKLIAQELQEGKITYEFAGGTALSIQGVTIREKQEIHVHFQWDQFDMLLQFYHSYDPIITEKNENEAEFQFMRDQLTIIFSCHYNKSLKTDPYRILKRVDDDEVWCRSLYSYIFNGNNQYAEKVHQYLFEKQQEINNNNEFAWNQNNYQALLNRYGLPREAAAKVKQNPIWKLHPFNKYLGDIQGKKIVHLMGSNGIKGVAMALLGADVSIVDFSMENQRFAHEVASEAGVDIQYNVSDVLSLDVNLLGVNNDIVLMELGVLHYYIDLKPLAELISKLLKDNGMFILHEFHPISTKLITSTGKKHKVTGDYFDPTIKTKDVAFTKHMSSEIQQELSKVFQRYWTLGEIITALAAEGLFVKILEEEPNHKVHDIGLPKTFTICAVKS
ncbi:class I SAM-dependent methyltransferase [Ferdinandcohnia quinoae]|uniref:Class I SAM-dependent methyltransferase n=1 Tax=Fredinandcohnia quinoae TaxID=2918902 RepID=A0AAW5ECS4_9BACI|nr:class I SAM-dependent methyltransferase [Fredinandcohnia sp. SECRCQ15]MCH1627251.1 class I SAM-dependent methyltransferase [Fredinandcohnia sp. SECRCQ15]